MGTFMMVVLVLISVTYMLARISTIAEQSKWEKIERTREEARQRYIDTLYGRDRDKK